MISSLASIERVCEFYNHPQKSFATVHVAGTNGKGSVCTKIAAALQAGGYRTGLYTSPHITTFRERIQINGEMISERDLKAFLREIKTQQVNLNYFEMATLLAFLYFRQKKIEVAVLETGLGGRWDATNICEPLVSVITSIGYDHVELLGPTLNDIAREKAGIIKKQIPVVVGPDVPLEIIEKIALEKKSTLYTHDKRGETYDQENIETARLALTIVRKHFPLEEKHIECGLVCKPPCRFEVHNLQKRVILDVAHNPHGFKRLLEQLESEFPHQSYRFVLGFSKEKDVGACAALIRRCASACHLVSAKHKKLASTDSLQAYFPRCHIESSIADGVKNALASSDEIIVVAGSFYIMKDVRRLLTNFIV